MSFSSFLLLFLSAFLLIFTLFSLHLTTKHHYLKTCVNTYSIHTYFVPLKMSIFLFFFSLFHSICSFSINTSLLIKNVQLPFSLYLFHLTTSPIILCHSRTCTSWVERRDYMILSLSLYRWVIFLFFTVPLQLSHFFFWQKIMHFFSLRASPRREDI